MGGGGGWVGGRGVGHGRGGVKVSFIVVGDKVLGRDTPATVDDINPALPMIRNIPYFPDCWVLKVMQDLYHQP